MKQSFFLFAAFVLLLAACSPAATSMPEEAVTNEPPAVTDAPTEAATQPSGPLTLTSTAFENEGVIPVQYGEVNMMQEMEGGYFFACTNAAEATNLSPALAWTNVPEGTVSLALVMWDQMNYAYPDMPDTAVFTHWVIYNIPVSATGLAEGQPAEPVLADGSLQGLNNYPSPYDIGYGGPCPGAETHLYVFTLYALDTTLNPTGGDLQTVLLAMEGHILAQTELKGYYTGE